MTDLSLQKYTECKQYIKQLCLIFIFIISFINIINIQNIYSAYKKYRTYPYFFNEVSFYPIL